MEVIFIIAFFEELTAVLEQWGYFHNGEFESISADARVKADISILKEGFLVFGDMVTSYRPEDCLGIKLFEPTESQESIDLESAIYLYFIDQIEKRTETITITFDEYKGVVYTFYPIASDGKEVWFMGENVINKIYAERIAFFREQKNNNAN